MLYTFGCSFTQYVWPTWADLLLTQIEGENWGQCGGGNKFIFESLIECDIKNKITKDDYVAIMWSTFTREDRYIANRWQGTGNVFNSKLYDAKFIEKYWDLKGAVLNNLNIICATVRVLNNIGCNWKMMTMTQLGNKENYINQELLTLEELQLFSDHLQWVEKNADIANPPLFEFSINQPNYTERCHYLNDSHPTPIIHGKWLDAVKPWEFIDYAKILEDSRIAEEFIQNKKFPQWDYPHDSYFSPNVKRRFPNSRI